MRRTLVVLFGLGMAVLDSTPPPADEDPKPLISDHEFEPWTYEGRPTDGLDPKTVCCYWQRGWLSMCDRPASEHARVEDADQSVGGSSP